MGIWRLGIALLADGGIVQEVVRVAVTSVAMTRHEFSIGISKKHKILFLC